MTDRHAEELLLFPDFPHTPYFLTLSIADSLVDYWTFISAPSIFINQPILRIVHETTSRFLTGLFTPAGMISFLA